MAERVEFEVDKDFFEQVVEKLEDQTDYGAGELRRGLLFMIGRRAGEMLEKIGDEMDQKLQEELKVAILHSGQEK